MKKVSASRKLLPDFEFLLKEAKAGSEPAQLEILQCLRKLGFKLAYQSGCIDRLGEEDAVQLARLGVLRAICDCTKATIYTVLWPFLPIRCVPSCARRCGGR